MVMFFHKCSLLIHLKYCSTSLKLPLKHFLPILHITNSIHYSESCGSHQVIKNFGEKAFAIVHYESFHDPLSQLVPQTGGLVVDKEQALPVLTPEWLMCLMAFSVLRASGEILYKY